MEAIGGREAWRGFGEPQREESPSSPRCLFHSTVRVMGPPNLPLQPYVSTPVTTSNNIPCLLPTAISTYLGLLRRGRRSGVGTGEKGLFQQRGKEEQVPSQRGRP